MQDLAAIFDTIPDGSWWAFAASFAGVYLVEALPIARQRYYNWRLDRRMQDPAGMMAWEYAEFERAIGDDLEEIDWAKALRAAILLGGYLGGSIWISDLGYDGWQTIGGAVLLALGALYCLWRRINDPEEAPLEFKVPHTEIPREAIMGFFSALCFAALILLLIVYVTPF